MIKKIFNFLFLAVAASFLLIPHDTFAGLEQWRIANTILREAGGAGTVSLTMVAEAIRNRYNEERRRNSQITFSDVLYQKNQFEGSERLFASKNERELISLAHKHSDWQVALNLANKMLSGTLNSNLNNGANSFNACKGSGCYKYIKRTDNGKYVWDPITEKGGLRDHLFYHWDLGRKFTHKYNSDTPMPAVGSDYSSSGDASAGTDSQGSDACTLTEIAQMYGFDSVDGKLIEKDGSSCWYCKIVIVLVNSYLKVVSAAMGTAQDLGKLILKLGFAIWLAYYLLLQLSSMKPVTPGKMTQEILVMGFKVALAYLAVVMGAGIVREYFLNPIVGTGVDYGMALFTELNASNGITVK